MPRVKNRHGRTVATIRSRESRFADMAETDLRWLDPMRSFTAATLVELDGVLGRRGGKFGVAPKGRLTREPRLNARLRPRPSGLSPTRFFGDWRMTKGYLGAALELLAAWPDGPSTWAEMCERLEVTGPDMAPSTVQTRTAMLRERGFLRMVGRRRGASINENPRAARRHMPDVVELTEEGRAARAWAQWCRARCMMGARPPAAGVRLRWVPYWLRGEDLPLGKVWRHGAGRGDWVGYLPGDADDALWPDFGKFDLGPLNDAMAEGQDGRNGSCGG